MNKTNLILIIFTIILFSCSDGYSGETRGDNKKTELPRKEMRAVWIATVDNMDWPLTKADVEKQKQEYINYLDIFAKYNINTLFVQIRPMADAFYPSTLEPWSQYLTGTQGENPGYDPLQFMLDEARKRNMEFHAWLNPYRIANNVNTFKPATDHIYNKHPEWTMTYRNLLIFRPALPEVRKFFCDVVEEIITKYDVDGIHFDDYFYPYPATGVELDDAADYLKYGGEYNTIEDFRRGNVNKAIEDIHNLITNKRPDILFSISPYAVWRSKAEDPIHGSDTGGLNNYDGLYADVRLWCEKKWIDIVIPQLYASTENANANFKKLAEWWPKNSFDVPVLIGYGLYKFGNEREGAIFMDPKELETQFFYANMQKKILGGVHFNSTAFLNNRINILDILGKEYSEPALVPFMGRKIEKDPEKISNLRIQDGKLTWDPIKGNQMRYVIYEIDGDNAKIVRIINEVTFSLTKKGRYAITALNRDNVESDLSEIINY